MQERTLRKIEARYGDSITSLQDLTAGEEPSGLFSLLTSCFRHLLDEDVSKGTSVASIRWRRMIHPLIMAVGPSVMKSRIILENRNYLMNPHAAQVKPDLGITLPKEPVIWCSNHAFEEDIFASILTARRHSCVLLGSLPRFFNTVDALTAWINGVVLINRKVRKTAAWSVRRIVRFIENGADCLIFPEGVWNKTPHQPILPLWAGAYRIACETGARVVPVVHYPESYTQMKGNIIHTVVDDPIRMDDLSEKAALTLLRDILATWHHLLMEAYGRTTREALLQGRSANAYWEEQLTERVKTAGYYDREIELTAHYRPRDIVTPSQVWEPVAGLKLSRNNWQEVLTAREIVRMEKERGYQEKF